MQFVTAHGGIQLDWNGDESEIDRSRPNRVCHELPLLVPQPGHAQKSTFQLSAPDKLLRPLHLPCKKTRLARQFRMFTSPGQMEGLGLTPSSCLTTHHYMWGEGLSPKPYTIQNKSHGSPFL